MRVIIDYKFDSINVSVDENELNNMLKDILE